MRALQTYFQQARQAHLNEAPSAASFANRYYSGTTYALWRVARDITAAHSRGLVLDAGSGRGGWKEIIEQAGTRESLDIAPKAGEQVTWIADLTDMPQVPADRYDAAVCHQVLEHVPSPPAAAAELFRVLKPGGALVVSVPHLSRQHELPHDYFRFTPQGLARLLEDTGFEIERLEIYGGLICFVHHQVSTLALGVASIFRPLHGLATALNAPLSMLAATLDRMLDRQGLLANGVIAVARKPHPGRHG